MRVTFTSKSLFRTILAGAMLVCGQSAMAQYVPATALYGTGGTGGEGFAKLVDADQSTKWGQSFDPVNPERAEAWVIFKAKTPVVPTNYFLITGNDTGADGNHGRNWLDWNIYGGNFENDLDAVKGAAGWVQIDERKNEVLPAKNFANVNFMFNKADGATTYQYFMVEVTRSVQGTDVYLQMSELGLGTYAEFVAFLNAESPESEPISYRIIDGDRNNGDGEGLKSLFDGNNFTKWGNGINLNDGAFAIFRTSRGIAPTYYKLTTGTDNAAWNHRNWRNWKIYGMNADDDSKATRNGEGWVLIDERNEVGEDVLPDYNSYEVYFDFNQGNTTKYQYFKIEIKDIQSGEGYMQMSEFALGDAAQFVLDKERYFDQANNLIDMTKPFAANLKSEYTSFCNTFKDATQPAQLGEAYNASIQMQGDINNSIQGYENYASVVGNMRTHYEQHNCLDEEGRATIGNYLNNEVAPNATFGNGSFVYIMNNCLLDNDALKQESIFANSLLERYASDLTDGAVPEGMQMTIIAGTETNTAEGPGFLFDGTNDTKWCTTNNPQVFVIFSAEEAFAPTFYKLTTANDTQGSPGRNWKNWKIYGGNFDSDEVATRDAEGWTLIDVKENINSSQLPAANFTDAYFYMSNPSATPFKYFRIEVEALVDGATQQMAEMAFGNDANRILKRNEYLEEYAAYNLDVVAQKQLIEDYQNALKNLETCASITDLGSLVNNLNSLRDQIEENIVAYAAYEDAVSQLDLSRFDDYPKMAAWLETYISESIEAGAVFKRGTYAYIMNNLPYNTADINAETNYLNDLVRASYDSSLICLDGYGANWGVHENWAKLIDGNLETKWGGGIEMGGNWVIFRTLGPSNPFFYTLNTGGDTEEYPGRNWRSWQIYGGNFENDGEATADTEGWVLIDDKAEVGQDRLHPTNTTASYFGFSSETTEEYTYYKVIVTKAYEGNAVQMQELIFGTEEEFEVIKNEYRNAAREFDYENIIADQQLLDAYTEAIEEIDECRNMEVLFRINYNLEQMRSIINTSAGVYGRYAAAVTDAIAFVAANPIDESEALSQFTSYINGVDEASELYPNGQAQYILETHELADSVVENEIAFVETLKKAAVEAGYTAGTDISSLIINPRFEKGAEGWNSEVYGYETNAERTMSAAEMVREKEVFDINQTLTGLKNGYYKVKLNAAFRPNNNDIYSYNYLALAYANDMATYVSVPLEGMVLRADAVNRENCWLEGEIADKPIEVKDEMSDEVVDTLGYVVWGIQSCCYAFYSGRHEITLVAKVTDGTLTFGVKNEGTPAGGDWCGMSNFRLTYLGEEADEASLAEAAAYNAARIETLNNTYVAADTEDENYRNAPNFASADREALVALAGQASYEALLQTGQVFENINKTKHAYVNLNNAKNKVYDRWIEELSGTPECEVMENDIYDVMDALALGTYANAEAALNTKAEIYAKYPDYLVLDENKVQNNVEAKRVAPFTYEAVANGARPNVALSGLYEAIDSTRCVLAIDYKANQVMTDGVFYFASPSLTADQMAQAGEITATDEWKTIYWDVTKAISEWNFGSADSWIRWDLTLGSASNLVVSIRHARIITTEQMKAEGGSINVVEMVRDNVPVLKQGIFTLSGQRVEKANRGIYIINGEKKLVK